MTPNLGEVLADRRIVHLRRRRRGRQDDDGGGDRARTRARAGERVAVVTIDPAPRLASALGFERARAASRALRGPAPGELWAMRLDPKRTLDELIAQPRARRRRRASARSRTASTASCRARSPARRSSARSPSSTSWIATRDFDAIVLDTPPSRNALDFLDAPGRLLRFFDGRALRCCSRPAASRRASRAAPAPLLGVLGRLIGGDGAARDQRVLHRDRRDDRRLRARAGAVAALLQRSRDGVRAGQLAAARGGRGGDRVRGRARARRAALARLVVNRVHPPVPDGMRRPPPRSRLRSATPSRTSCSRPASARRCSRRVTRSG